MGAFYKYTPKGLGLSYQLVLGHFIFATFYLFIFPFQIYIGHFYLRYYYVILRWDLHKKNDPIVRHRYFLVKM